MQMHDKIYLKQFTTFILTNEKAEWENENSWPWKICHKNLTISSKNWKEINWYKKNFGLRVQCYKFEYIVITAGKNEEKPSLVTIHPRLII